MKTTPFLVALAGCVLTATVATTAEKKFASNFIVPASEWSSMCSNAYFILEPGYTLEFDANENGKKVHLVIAVLNETVKIGGVETRVVEERETTDGQLSELARNFFAASTKTKDIYYFGEDVDTYENGKLAGHGGSWRAGVNLAKYGLMMPGTPSVGMRYYQEVAGKVARDRAEIVSLTESIVVPAGKFTNCLKTEETTPLEKGAPAYKFYAPGVGLIKDGAMELIRNGSVLK